METNINTIYELWDLSIPNIPEHSSLFHLEPIRPVQKLVSHCSQGFESNPCRLWFNEKLGFDTVTDSLEKKDKVS